MDEKEKLLHTLSEQQARMYYYYSCVGLPHKTIAHKLKIRFDENNYWKPWRGKISSILKLTSYKDKQYCQYLSEEILNNWEQLEMPIAESQPKSPIEIPEGTPNESPKISIAPDAPVETPETPKLKTDEIPEETPIEAPKVTNALDGPDAPVETPKLTINEIPEETLIEAPKVTNALDGPDAPVETPETPIEPVKPPTNETPPQKPPKPTPQTPSNQPTETPAIPPWLKIVIPIIVGIGCLGGLLLLVFFFSSLMIPFWGRRTPLAQSTVYAAQATSTMTLGDMITLPPGAMTIITTEVPSNTPFPTSTYTKTPSPTPSFTPTITETFTPTSTSIPLNLAYEFKNGFPGPFIPEYGDPFVVGDYLTSNSRFQISYGDIQWTDYKVEIDAKDFYASGGMVGDNFQIDVRALDTGNSMRLSGSCDNMTWQEVTNGIAQNMSGGIRFPCYNGKLIIYAQGNKFWTEGTASASVTRPGHARGKVYFTFEVRQKILGI